MNINDQHEAIMKGSYREWNKTYIGSFSWGSSENMAMWGLYGLPWEDAVRLCIPKEDMLKWIDSIESVELWESGHVQASLHPSEVVLTDIAYVDGFEGSPTVKLTHNQNTRSISGNQNLYGLDRDPGMTGYIKNYAWHYENEVRLKIRLPYDTGHEKIRVNIPREATDAISITTGPCFQWKEDLLFIGLLEAGRINDSGFKHLVKYRPLCSLCQHEHFQRKENNG